jgi:membrane associated rhomboid family serine protease
LQTVHRKPKNQREMPAQLCPFCRGLNSAGERRCYRCGRPLPGKLASGVLGFFQGALGGDGVMTRITLGLCVLVFALCFATDRRMPLWGHDTFALSTTLRFGAIVSTGRGSLALAEPWRYLAAVFVHFNLLHLVMNGLWLARMGAVVERELGKARFVILFTLAGALGFVASDFYYGFAGPPTAGASGAVFGLFGAAIGVAYAKRDPNWKQILIENVVWLLILAFASNVNNAAHAGGLASGALFGFLFTKEPRKLKLDLPLALVAGLCLALSVASVVLSAASPIWRIVRAQEQSREF